MKDRPNNNDYHKMYKADMSDRKPINLNLAQVCMA